MRGFFRIQDIEFGHPRIEVIMTFSFLLFGPAISDRVGTWFERNTHKHQYIEQ